MSTIRIWPGDQAPTGSPTHTCPQRKPASYIMFMVLNPVLQYLHCKTQQYVDFVYGPAADHEADIVDSSIAP
jgi:hypothetical protein